jgi:predicted RNA binding protein YcfA (HicA-like mRNA interferase family)
MGKLPRALPTLTGLEMYNFVKNKLDFFDTSHSGGHFRVAHLDGRRVTISRHGKRPELSKSDMSSILRALEMTHDEFLAKYYE